MNQDQVKEKLLKLYECKIDFKVIFSGKKAKRINGLYKHFDSEIIIHNKNFLDKDGNQNDMLLMFTAIHELAHHVLITEKGKKSPRAHSQEFWATFHDLLDIAEKKKIYKAEIDDEMQGLIEEARDISKQIAGLQRDLGQILLAINDACKQNGLRYEDIVEREAQIDKQAAKIAVISHKMGDQGVGADIQAEAARQRDDDKRALIIAAGQEGKSVVQAKKYPTKSEPVQHEDETVTLIKEEKRIQRTIKTLTRRLEEIEQQLIDRGEKKGGDDDD